MVYGMGAGYGSERRVWGGEGRRGGEEGRGGYAEGRGGGHAAQLACVRTHLGIHGPREHTGSTCDYTLKAHVLYPVGRVAILAMCDKG